MGLNIIPSLISLSDNLAIAIQNCGIPWIKLDVPSIGSIINTLSLSLPFISSDSSITKL